MSRDRALRWVLPLLLLALILVAWELWVRLTGTAAYIMPAPSRVGLTFVRELPILLYHARVTLTETLVGLLLATLLSVCIAVLMDAFATVRRALYPILVATQTLPVIVLAPVFIIYLGFGLAPKVLIVVLMCFFPITISFADAMAAQDSRRVNLLRAMGASKWQIYRLVKMPGALPAFFSGLAVAATYSMSGAVVGEWLSSSAGLGYYMLRVKNGYMLDKVFASVLMVALLSLALTALVRMVSHLAVKPPKKRRRKK